MRKKLTIALTLATLALTAAVRANAQAQAEKYPVDSASVEHAGVPKGELIHCRWDRSAIFPGTRREYWIYVPAQYRPERPACVYVNQDGVQWKAPTVFDNLIARKEMPVTVGVFIQPGTFEGGRSNRSFEYDTLSDAYARFLLEEILPEVEKCLPDWKALHAKEAKIPASH